MSFQNFSWKSFGKDAKLFARGKDYFFPNVAGAAGEKLFIENGSAIGAEGEVIVVELEPVTCRISDLADEGIVVVLVANGVGVGFGIFD